VCILKFWILVVTGLVTSTGLFQLQVSSKNIIKECNVGNAFCFQLYCTLYELCFWQQLTCHQDKSIFFIGISLSLMGWNEPLLCLPCFPGLHRISVITTTIFSGVVALVDHMCNISALRSRVYRLLNWTTNVALTSATKINKLFFLCIRLTFIKNVVWSIFVAVLAREFGLHCGHCYSIVFLSVLFTDAVSC
jgi:hypothetical protein